MVRRPMDEQEYFKTRALEERQRAETAPNKVVADIHAELAEQYELLAADPRRRILRIVTG